MNIPIMYDLYANIFLFFVMVSYLTARRVGVGIKYEVNQKIPADHKDVLYIHQTFGPTNMKSI